MLCFFVSLATVRLSLVFFVWVLLLAHLMKYLMTQTFLRQNIHFHCLRMGLRSSCRLREALQRFLDVQRTFEHKKQLKKQLTFFDSCSDASWSLAFLNVHFGGFLHYADLFFHCVETKHVFTSDIIAVVQNCT